MVEHLQNTIKHLVDRPHTLPAADDVFKAIKLCPPAKTKVIIIGQDPYPDRDYATGLAFSVPKETSIPGSLSNIFNELVADLGVQWPTNGDLTPWAEQGVLLLNDVLTVRCGHPGSHRGMGWEPITDALVRAVLQREEPLVIIAWGRQAQKKLARLKSDVHPSCLILTGGHPSPLNMTTPFAGGRYFSKANAWLVKCGVGPVNWRLE